MPNLNTGLTSEQVMDAFYRALHDYTNEQILALLAGKQNTLTFDDEPTASSDNPVKSKGIKSYVDTGLSGKQDTLTFDSTPTANSDNPVKSNGIKIYVDNAVQDKITITNILGAGTRISATQSAPIDLDDYTSVGRFNWLSASSANMSHLPVSGKGGLLEVSYIQGNSTILQKVYLSDGANSPIAFYQRFRYGSNPATWTGWYKFEGTAVT